MNWLSGKKSYIVAIGIIAHAIVGYLNGTLDLNGAMLEVLNGLGLGALRMGVAKNGAAKP